MGKIKESTVKSIKIVGLILFFVGFFLFNASFFWGRFELTTQIAERHIEDPRLEKLFLDEAGEMIDQTYTSTFAFVESLSVVFREVNEQQIRKYGFSDVELEKILSFTGETFTIEDATRALKGDSSVVAFKKKTLFDFAGHLEGKTISIEDLEGVDSKIKKYGIVNAVGFDRYREKDLTYRLTRESSISPVKKNPGLFLMLTFGLCIAGAMMYILPKVRHHQGIQNNGIFFNPMKNVGWLGIVTGTWLIGFYVLLYFYPEYMTNWIIMVDPVSQLINGNEAGRFFLYGFIYTLCILVMGVRMLIHYRHSRYQMLRTVSVMFFQLSFAFLIPEILIRLNQPYFDFKNIWPLDYDFFFDSQLNELISAGTLGIFMLGWGIALIIFGVPIFTYFYGKRWYCSWVCGCGGLAETMGDPYRQLSDKSVKAWKVERWMVHGVLVFAVVMTVAVLYTYWTGASWFLFVDSYTLRSVYGAWIGAGFAGVIGTGFYPLMGNRVWCRFGCPLAAYLGIVQRFKSRFRITTNGGQCISCGNCSTYCEMGIDVRWYAQRGQNIVRASCVGCGICSSVCPRGVLNLEVKDEKGRFGKPILIGNNHVSIHD